MPVKKDMSPLARLFYAKAKILGAYFFKRGIIKTWKQRSYAAGGAGAL